MTKKYLIITSAFCLLALVIGLFILSMHKNEYADRALYFVRALQKGDYESASLALPSDLRESATPQELARWWHQEATAKYGQLKGSSIVRIGPEGNPKDLNNVYSVYVACNSEKGTKYVVVKFDRLKNINLFGVHDSLESARNTLPEAEK